MNNGTLKRTVLLLITLILVILSVIAGIISYAEYTKSSRAKRVVATYESEGERFSSNQLGMHDNTMYNYRYFHTTSENVGASTNITVCNFAQGNPQRFNDIRVTYSFNAKFMKDTGTGYVDAVAADLSGHVVTITFGGVTKTLNAQNVSDSFTGNVLSNEHEQTDIYNVVFSGEFNDSENNIYLFLEAVPTAPANNGLSTLDALCSTKISTSRYEAKWEGKFNESMAGNSPADFDGFRYVISGSGSGSIKLSWDSAYMHPTELFLDGMTVENGNGTWRYVEFDVDSDDVNRYDLQFYYGEGVLGTINSWTGFSNDTYVKCEYTADSDAGND